LNFEQKLSSFFLFFFTPPTHEPPQLAEKREPLSPRKHKHNEKNKKRKIAHILSVIDFVLYTFNSKRINEYLK
jgi:hypothetical protein